MRALVAEVQNALSFDEATVMAIPAPSCTEYTSAKSFLESRFVGVYSCVRVKALAKASSELSTILVEWPFHLQRLLDGIQTVDCTLRQDHLRLDKLKLVVHDVATAVLAQWLAVDTEDGMLSVLLYPLRDRSDYGVAVHISPMPTPKCLVSTVLVYGERRPDPRCKHTQWIKDRVPIEKHAAQLAATRGECIHEVVLSKPGPGGDRVLLEGLITNFFVGTYCGDGSTQDRLTLGSAVKGGTVYTADEDVLRGSTRELVLKACADLKIVVVLEAPKLSERKLWQAAFVTSVVRVVIDVTRILSVGDSKENDMVATDIPSDTSGYTRRIREQIVNQRMYLK